MPASHGSGVPMRLQLCPPHGTSAGWGPWRSPSGSDGRWPRCPPPSPIPPARPVRPETYRRTQRRPGLLHVSPLRGRTHARLRFQPRLLQRPDPRRSIEVAHRRHRASWIPSVPLPVRRELVFDYRRATRHPGRPPRTRRMFHHVPRAREAPLGPHRRVSRAHRSQLRPHPPPLQC